MIALVLGHDRALKVYGDTRTAARSQYWMLALMVGLHLARPLPALAVERVATCGGHEQTDVFTGHIPVDTSLTSGLRPPARRSG